MTCCLGPPESCHSDDLVFLQVSFLFRLLSTWLKIQLNPSPLIPSLSVSLFSPPPLSLSVCVCVCLCAHLCVRVWKLAINLKYFPLSLFTLLVEKVSHCAWSLAFVLGWRGNQFSASACLCCLLSWGYRCKPLHSGFLCVLGI